MSSLALLPLIDFADFERQFPPPHPNIIHKELKISPCIKFHQLFSCLESIYICFLLYVKSYANDVNNHVSKDLPIRDHCIVFILSQCLSSPRLDFRLSLVSGLRSAGSFPEQRLVIEPTPCRERTGYRTRGCSRGNLNRYPSDIFVPKTKLLLKTPSQPHLRVYLHTTVWLLYFIWSMSKQRKSR